MRLVHTLSTQQSIYAHLLYLTQLEVNGIMAKPWLMMISKAIGKLILFWKAWTWHNSILWVTLLLMKSSNHSWLRFCLDWSGWMVNNCIDFQFLEGHFFFLISLSGCTIFSVSIFVFLKMLPYILRIELTCNLLYNRI